MHNYVTLNNIGCIIQLIGCIIQLIWRFSGDIRQTSTLKEIGENMNNLYKMATFATLICVLMISCAMFAESSDAADYETVVQDGITYKLLPGVGGGGEHC